VTLKARVVLAAMFVMLSGCTRSIGDPVPSMERVGLTRLEGGRIQILFAACTDERVTRLEVGLTDESFEELLEVVWAIESSDSRSNATAFTIGTTPNGFTERQRLIRPLSRDVALDVVVTSNQVGTIPFNSKADDVRSGEVLVNGDYIDAASFEENARSTCRR